MNQWMEPFTLSLQQQNQSIHCGWCCEASNELEWCCWFGWEWGELGFFLFGGLGAGAPANAPQTEEDKRSQAAHPFTNSIHNQSHQLLNQKEQLIGDWVNERVELICFSLFLPFHWRGEQRAPPQQPMKGEERRKDRAIAEWFCFFFKEEED